jgi:uncharacterized protein (TIGR03437 family)
MTLNKLTGLLILCAGVAIPAAAQDFDTSGNNKLNGDYFVRQVVTTNLDPNTSAIGRAISIIGIMNFDGNGNYAFNGQMLDTNVGGSAVAYSVNGSYSVESNGMAQFTNPIDNTDTEVGAITDVGPISIVASATEGPYNDVFVAIQAGPGATNSSVTGPYNVGFIDFLQADASQVRDGYYTLATSGDGNFGDVSVNGAMANQGNNDVTQVFPGVTYSITSGNGAGILTFPDASTPSDVLVSGQKTFYVSADSKLLLGGDPNGFDLIMGVQALSGSSSNSMYQGTYYAAALENDASDVANGNNNIDSFSGSTLALGTQEDTYFGSQGATILHERLLPFKPAAYDYTTDGTFDFSSGPNFNDGFYQYEIGANGAAVLIVGTGSTYSMSVNLKAQSTTPATSVFIDPLSIFNAATYAPITNSVAPGEFVSIFGSGFTNVTESAQSLPLSKHLGNVQVTVNGRLAPLDFVSPTQINLLIPYATSENYATFRVFNNGVPSNKVTVYTNLTAPGVFTINSLDGTYPSGIGPAAVLHADFSLVTLDNPAVGGETLLLYLTGLGSVTPPVDDGAPGSSDPNNLNIVDEYTAGNLFVDVSDPNGNDLTANVTFAGLAPGFAGLYQINFEVPSGLASGTGYVNVSTNEAYTYEAKLFLQ